MHAWTIRNDAWYGPFEQQQQAMGIYYITKRVQNGFPEGIHVSAKNSTVGSSFDGHRHLPASQPSMVLQSLPEASRFRPTKPVLTHRPGAFVPRRKRGLAGPGAPLGALSIRGDATRPP
jgi:hypothetical protein